MEALLRLWDDAPDFAAIVRAFEMGDRYQLVTGLSGSQRSFLVAGLVRRLASGALIVTADLGAAEAAADDLRTWLGPDRVVVFPPLEVLPFELLAQSPELRAARLAVLARLVRGEPAVVVAPVQALLRRLAPPEAFLRACVQVAAGGWGDPEELARRLAAAGYEPEAMVQGPGEFSRRGGIVDVWPLPDDEPLRLEFFGDTVASVRRFSAETQRSTGGLQACFIPPAREAVWDAAASAEAQRRIRRELGLTVRRLEGQPGLRERARRLDERVCAHLEALAEGQSPEALELYLPYAYDHLATLVDYLCPRSLVVADEPVRLAEAARESVRQAQESFTDALARGRVLPGQQAALADFEALWAAARRGPGQHRVVACSLLSRRLPDEDPQRITSIPARQVQLFHGNWGAFGEEIGLWRRQGYRTVLLAPTPERADRARECLVQQEIYPITAETLADGDPDRARLVSGQVAVLVGTVAQGFVLPGLKLVCLTDQELLGRTRRRPRPRAFKEGARLGTLRELRVGDYVVHVTHGIGQYAGIQTLAVDGQRRDYLTVRYAGADRLYVPTDQLDKVQRYVGVEGQEPRLSRLGGRDWSRTKGRVKESVEALARELLELYAAREAEVGHAFAADSPWQAEFEATFRYEETPDQLQAVEEIKRDMERPRPMDRLLCGDVGYGKTEVAVRAAFKAVNDGVQVAVLVPTTVLAQQHYHTFRERFAGYPVEIDLLSRFRSRRRQAQTLKGLRQGTVDIVIGTHRLLQEDVRFKRLGLLVVDEEHRFGVVHKERLKQMKRNVDCLTLSATPIPRTLQMALTGIRDMSVIETPPEDRYPVQTYVAEYSDELVAEAIRRELDRGGQVFYVHNRVQTIDAAAARVKRLVPAARIAVAHGQMEEDRLEQVMVDFLGGAHDVLVCTTVIESGLDMANVNTLVVEDADHLGLAQLYQLRGRVGRSNRLAYAYFTYRRDSLLTETAEKRLEALRDFTELGSGFKLALRDLEIRGAGNLLGPEQHGHVAAVGFDLYAQLLEEAIARLKGQARPELPTPTLELRVDAFIPDAYVADARQKLEVYKKLAGVQSRDEVEEAAAELSDRFGPPPQPVQNLLQVARLRALAAQVGVVSLVQQERTVELRLSDRALVDPERFARFVQAHAGQVFVTGGDRPALRVLTRGLGDGKLLGFLEALLDEWRRTAAPEADRPGQTPVAAAPRER